MAIALGEDFALEVETAVPGTFVAVLGMDEWEQSDEQTIDTFPTFGDGGNSLGIPTPPDISFSISGFFDPVDPGQVLLRTHGRNRTTVNINVLHDGTNGYEQEVRVGSRTHGASASGGPQRTSFTFAPVGAPTIVGTGPLF